MLNPGPHSDNELFSLIAEGNESAFTIFFRAYYPALYNNALHYVKNEFWAEEIVQEVFTAVWSGRLQLADVVNPGGWVHRLVWNKAVDRIRRQATELKAQYTLQSVMNETPDTETTTNRERMYALLEAAVAALPPQRQTIYRLRYQEKLGLDEIGRQLNVSRNTVRNHLSLALDNIRTYLLHHADLYTFCWLCFHFF